MLRGLRKLFKPPPVEQVQLLLTDYLKSLQSSLAGFALAEVVGEQVKAKGVDAAIDSLRPDMGFVYSDSYGLFVGKLAQIFVALALPDENDEVKLKCAVGSLTIALGTDDEQAVNAIVTANEAVPSPERGDSLPSETEFEQMSDEEKERWAVAAAADRALSTLLDAFQAGKTSCKPGDDELRELSEVLYATVD